MPLFVHITSNEIARKILRRGLRGRERWVHAGQPPAMLLLQAASHCMPVTPNFYATFQ